MSRVIQRQQQQQQNGSYHRALIPFVISWGFDLRFILQIDKDHRERMKVENKKRRKNEKTLVGTETMDKDFLEVCSFCFRSYQEPVRRGPKKKS
jgi:hypothetical protein